MQEKRLNATQFVQVVIQLSLLLLVIRQFQIESPAFLRLTLLTYGGFLVHSVLPLRFRLPFFVSLSLTGITLIFGLSDGIWLIGIGLVLIGLCHAPFQFATRVALFLLIGGGLVFMRVDWLTVPWSQAIWPILGSMFMFRLIVYLYDRKHETGPASLWSTLAYFFLLPNICFPLFPVIDYKTFRRTYYDRDSYQIYQTGVLWMTRGVIHLLLYRFVYHYFMISPAEVTSLSELLRFLLANLFLYLRISGQFHMIVGMLHLFGFHLPETHHHYYLASSFTDYWRRINIYWKDFMLKLFYYPAYFKLRRWGNTQALIGSTLIVFVGTWLLHMYQWLWLRGSLLLSSQDVLFWSILAVLVVMNSLSEAKQSQGRSRVQALGTTRETAVLALRTLATFSTICVLWSLWTSESLSEWASLWSVLGEGRLVARESFRTLLAVGVFLSIPVAAVIVGLHRKNTQQTMFLRSPAATTGALLLLFLLGNPDVYTQFGPKAATTIYPLQTNGLNWMEIERLERGYYEELLTVDRFNSQLWQVYMNKPLDWLDVKSGSMARPTNDFLQRELTPSSTSYSYRVTINTNRWGMRDRDYEKQPSADTFRIAMLGASSVMGLGVEDNKTFETLVENRLNSENVGGPPIKYEILNFAAPSYTPLQQLIILDRALAFMPNAVFYVAAHGEAGRASRYLREIVKNKVDIPYEYLRELVRKAEINSAMSETAMARRLRPFDDEMLSWLYNDMVDTCRNHKILPVWAYMPMPSQEWPAEKIDYQIKQAEEAGFIILDLRNAYKNRDENTLRVAEWDTHPNVEGHRLLASALYQAMQEKKVLLFSNPVGHAKTP